MLLAAASPALAADQIFHPEESEVILETFDGRAYWELQAICAGHHGATANYFARQGERAKAEQKDMRDANTIRRDGAQARDDARARDAGERLRDDDGWRRD